jgi:hypothetical protein
LRVALRPLTFGANEFANLGRNAVARTRRCVRDVARMSAAICGYLSQQQSRISLRSSGLRVRTINVIARSTCDEAIQLFLVVLDCLAGARNDEIHVVPAPSRDPRHERACAHRYAVCSRFGSEVAAFSYNQGRGYGSRRKAGTTAAGGAAAMNHQLAEAGMAGSAKRCRSLRIGGTVPRFVRYCSALRPFV